MIAPSIRLSLASRIGQRQEQCKQLIPVGPDILRFPQSNSINNKQTNKHVLCHMSESGLIPKVGLAPSTFTNPLQMTRLETRPFLLALFELERFYKTLDVSC